MSSPVISYTPRPDATPEAEISALSAVYSFILECREKRATPESRADAGKEINESSGKSIIPE